jgi:hypothetical protein
VPSRSLDLVVTQQLGMGGHDVADIVVPREEALLRLQTGRCLGGRSGNAALVVAQRGDAVLASSSAISFSRSMRTGTRELLPLRSVGPLPPTRTTPGTFCSSLMIGSSRVALSSASPLPLNRSERCLVPVW